MKHYKSLDRGNACIDRGAHRNDGIQRNAIELGELRQQINAVESAAKEGEDHRAYNQTPQGAGAALFGVVDDGGGQNQTAAHGKIGEITHKGGGGTLQQQLQQDFDALTGHGGAGSQVEAAQQHRQLREVQLVKFGCQEQ